MGPTTLKLHPYNESRLEQILDFSIQNPVRPFYPRTLLKRFITQLTSSASFIYDVYQGSSRVAVGVLLDTVNNPSGSANLEIIGKVGSISDDELFNFIFSKLPKEISVQVGSHATLAPSVKLLERFGFHFLYDTFEMKKVDMEVPFAKTTRNIEFKPLSLEKYSEYYTLLVKSFEKNLEASIPSIEEMKASFTNHIKTKPPGTNLLFIDGKLAGFCTVIKDENDPTVGEVHMIGVDPESRGKGLGSVLLSKAISELKNLGCLKCHLTVAAQNQSALNLYKRFGFAVDQAYTSYLRKKL